MATIIGALRVTLGLETAAFETGAKKAEARAKAMGNDFEALGLKVGRISKAFMAAGAAMVGSQVVSALAGMVSQSLELAKGIERSAQLAGASVEEFQRAAHAARSVGVESENLADIYKDVNEKFGDFIQTGGGELKDFFDKIAPKVGVTADQFARLSGPEALQLYFNTLQKAGLSHKEMIFYMESVASNSSKLIPLLRDNGKEFRNLAAAADEFGMVLTREEIRNLSETSAKFDQFKKILSVRIASEVAANKEAIDALATTLLDLVTALGKALKAWHEFRLSLGIQKARNTSVSLFATEAEKAVARRQVELLQYRLDVSRGEPHKPVTIYDSGQPVAGGGGGATLYPKGVTRPPAGKDWNFAGGGKSPFPARAMGGGVAQDDELARRLEALGGEFHKFGDELDDLKGGMVKVVPTAKELAKTTADMGRSMAGTIEGLLGALNGIAFAFGGRSSSGGKFLGKLSAVIGLATEFGKVGAFGKGLQSHLLDGARAMGGPVNAGGLYLVGERGPELFSPGRSGSIIPNHAMGGGNVYHIKGNLLTPEFWAQIQAMDVEAARGGARLARQQAAFNVSRRLA